ncbi:hypothetical protein AMTR_s00039p00034180 [Amborella trichopoda]|uniref:Uncharacterized protein n=1 Tax=Amborella trichopoda TaxID=13333 RepID=U5D0F8_AMBTC|nr:hypothetical protein AMTR_s00039p00034180 [Amborella trichopoda]
MEFRRNDNSKTMTLQECSQGKGLGDRERISNDKERLAIHRVVQMAKKKKSGKAATTNRIQVTRYMITDRTVWRQSVRPY